MIQERVVLVNFSASVWSARKFDKKKSREITDNYGVDEKKARVNKILLADDAIKRYASLQQEARMFHYSLTLPWLDNGTRMCPVGTYMEYQSGMNQREGWFWSAVNDFLLQYPYLVQDAQSQGNEFYNPEDFPNESRIKSKFSWVVTVLPMPESNDFRVTLNATEEQRIRENLQKTITGNLENAARELWSRVHDAVKRIHESCKDPDKVFHKTMLSNAMELCELLPKLNIMDDPALEEVRKVLEKDILIFSSEDLRKHKDVRQEVANLAGDLTTIAQGNLDAMEEVWA